MDLVNTNKLRLSLYKLPMEMQPSWTYGTYHSDDHGRGIETNLFVHFGSRSFHLKYRPHGKSKKMLNLSRVKCRNGKTPNDLLYRRGKTYNKYPISGLIDGVAECWTEEGKYSTNLVEHELDLIEVIEEISIGEPVAKIEYEI